MAAALGARLGTHGARASLVHLWLSTAYGCRCRSGRVWGGVASFPPRSCAPVGCRARRTAVTLPDSGSDLRGGTPRTRFWQESGVAYARGEPPSARTGDVAGISRYRRRSECRARESQGGRAPDVPRGDIRDARFLTGRGKFPSRALGIPAPHVPRPGHPPPHPPHPPHPPAPPIPRPGSPRATRTPRASCVCPLRGPRARHILRCLTIRTLRGLGLSELFAPTRRDLRPCHSRGLLPTCAPMGLETA
jgi:hypothetical protein